MSERAWPAMAFGKKAAVLGVVNARDKPDPEHRGERSSHAQIRPNDHHDRALGRPRRGLAGSVARIFFNKSERAWCSGKRSRMADFASRMSCAACAQADRTTDAPRSPPGARDRVRRPRRPQEAALGFTDPWARFLLHKLLELRLQLFPRAREAGHHRAERNFQDGGDILVGQALDLMQDEDFARFHRSSFQCARQQLAGGVLLPRDADGGSAVEIFVEQIEGDLALILFYCRKAF